MSFTATELQRIKGVNGVTIIGKYVNTAGSTGGTIKPSLSQITGALLQPWGSSVASNFPVVNASTTTFPVSSTTGVTVVTTANEGGIYMITGV
jgi:hypothetical protein